MAERRKMLKDLDKFLESLDNLLNDENNEGKSDKHELTELEKLAKEVRYSCLPFLKSDVDCSLYRLTSNIRQLNLGSFTATKGQKVLPFALDYIRELRSSFEDFDPNIQKVFNKRETLRLHIENSSNLPSSNKT